MQIELPTGTDVDDDLGRDGCSVLFLIYYQCSLISPEQIGVSFVAFE